MINWPHQRDAVCLFLNPEDTRLRGTRFNAARWTEAD